MLLKKINFTVAQKLTRVFLETDGKRGLSDFVLKQVLLIQEQYDGSFHEPLAVANGIKQLHRLNHAIHLLVFGQHQIVT
jgi:hypothetical protein